MVEAKLAFLEVQIEGGFGQAVELGQAPLGEAPEAFDAIDVVVALGEVIAAVADAPMLGITQVDQSVVAGQTVGEDFALQANMSTNQGLQRGGFAVGHDLGVDVLAALEHAEDGGFLAGAASAFAAYSPWPEERFVDFDLTGEGRMLLAFVGDDASHGQEDGVDRTHAQAGQLSGVGGGEIQ